MSTANPVLLLVFNRPDTTQRVFDAIRKARPERLYVAADGPRAGRPEEAERCEAARRIALAVDWPRTVTTLLRDANLGRKKGVSSAVTWFFEHEPQGIILEDDCLPDPSFFPYCDELLERYRDDPRVMCISGDNFISSTWVPRASYYFSIYVHIWGWASWRRAWRFYDVDMPAWQTSDKSRLLKRRLPRSRRARAHWRSLFDDVSNGRIDTWDYQWTFACWNQGGLSCMPKLNLISNIGFGAGATHTISAESKLANLPAAAIATPLQHPEAVEADINADLWTSEHVFDISERPPGLSDLRRIVRGRLRQVRSALVR